jgi:UPF0042 nucleotide-binding protein
MEFLIVSGLSGAGKSRVADVLEDMSYYCVDNMPVALIQKFAQLCLAANNRYDRVALVTDIRERSSFDELFEQLRLLLEMGCPYHIIFVEADVPVIVRRYKESRRRHPLAEPGVSIEKAIENEIALLAPVREKANSVINTSSTTLGMLQSRLYQLFAGGEQGRALAVNVISFGFKFGVPIESDLVFDVRFLPNPYYVPELRDKTGMDAAVYDYVLGGEETARFMEKFQDLIAYLLPLYAQEGKTSLVISIGCTGGHHRSVAISRALCAQIVALGYNALNINRDIGKL